MAMTVESILRVSFAGQPRAIYLPPDLTWKPPDANYFYVQIAEARSEINRLLNQPISGKNKKKLQFTSIIETLIQLRDDNVLAVVEAFENKDVKIDLEVDGPCKRKEADGKRMKSKWPQTQDLFKMFSNSKIYRV